MRDGARKGGWERRRRRGRGGRGEKWGRKREGWGDCKWMLGVAEPLGRDDWTSSSRQYGWRLMALVTGDPVVSSLEKPSLSCLIYVSYVYICIYQTVFRHFHYQPGQLTARMTASPANLVEWAINFSPVEILAPPSPSFFLRPLSARSTR